MLRFAGTPEPAAAIYQNKYPKTVFSKKTFKFHNHSDFKTYSETQR